MCLYLTVNVSARNDVVSLFIIEDFIDIRYGCMDGGVRKVDNIEHKKIMGYITNMEKINQKVKSQNAL